MGAVLLPSLIAIQLLPKAEGQEGDGSPSGPPAKSDDWTDERRALNEKATQAFAGADWQQASHFYQKILEREPDNPLILANLGAVEYQLRDLQACCHYLEKALRLKPDLVASREMLGMAYHLREMPMRAVAALSRAVADQPESPRALNQLAVVLQSQGWYDGAERSLRRAIQLDPSFRDAHFNLALVYTDREPSAEALARQHYLKARQLGSAVDEELEKQLGISEKTGKEADPES